MKDASSEKTDVQSEEKTDSNMALKTLPRVTVKDMSLLSTTVTETNNTECDTMSVESLHLHLSEDEEDEKTAAAVKKELASEDDKKEKTASETEDDILNKFEDDNEDEMLFNAETDDEETYKTLTVSAASKKETEGNINSDNDKNLFNVETDDEETHETFPPNTATEEKTETNSDQVTNGTDLVYSEIVNNEDSASNKNEKESNNFSGDNIIVSKIEENVQEKEESEKQNKVGVIKTEEQTEDGDAKKEKNEDGESKKDEAEENDESIDELLKTQIMDTEDLLQIVEKDTEENDKEGSTSNSPKPEDAEADTEKIDEEEESELDKGVDKEEDGVDIEESSPVECDMDIDKEYQNIIRSEELKNKEEAEGKKNIAMEVEVQANEAITEVTTPKVDTNSADDNCATTTITAITTTTTATTTSDIPAEIEETKNDLPENEKSSPPPTTDDVAKPSTDTDNGDLSPAKSIKRSLSASEIELSSKRPKLVAKPSPSDPSSLSSDEPVVVESSKKPSSSTPSKLIFLDSYAKLMQDKPLKKLSRKQLEQFCLQKMCEAIFHRSEIGELRHQLGVHEQMIEMWRKEIQQLTKQARDLEIVNKRLLQEVRSKSDREKLMVPVKITRSVGLQVRSDNLVTVINPKRRPSIRTLQPITTPLPPPSKQIKSPVVVTKAKPVQVKKSNAILSQALRSTTTAVGSSSGTAVSTAITPILATVPAIAVPVTSSKQLAVTNHVDKGFIDLTEEDDKKPTTTTTQNLRIVATPAVKTPNGMTTTNLVNSPRFMCVYNNNQLRGILDTSKSGQNVVVKLNSNFLGQPNGVLAVSNGSTIAVSNGQVRTAQVQQIRPSAQVQQARPIQVQQARPSTQVQQARLPSIVATSTSRSSGGKPILKHPAPLPAPPTVQVSLPSFKAVPPKPHLSIRRSSDGIVLSWKMPYILKNYEPIASYQLYAYQETAAAPTSEMWRKVGDVKALALPMACTLTQFADGNKYYFAVRAVDVQKRMGPFSDPQQILL